MSKAIEDVLDEIWYFINDTLNDAEELEIATVAGFPKKQFDDALKLYKKSLELKQIETIAEGRRVSATDAHKQTKIALKKHYAGAIAVAKRIFKDDLKMEKQLELTGIRKTSYPEFRMQVFNFYSIVLRNEELIKQFEEKAITKAQLDQGMKLYSEMEDLKLTQRSEEKTRAKAQDTYDANLAQLQTWYTNAKAMIKAWKKMQVGSGK